MVMASVRIAKPMRFLVVMVMNASWQKHLNPSCKKQIKSHLETSRIIA